MKVKNSDKKAPRRGCFFVTGIRQLFTDVAKYMNKQKADPIQGRLFSWLLTAAR